MCVGTSPAVLKFFLESSKHLLIVKVNAKNILKCVCMLHVHIVSPRGVKKNNLKSFFYVSNG